MLTPHLDPLSGSRQQLAPTDAAAWFQSYDQMLVANAKLAQSLGVETFSLGTELSTMAVPQYAAEWNKIIADVRSVYSGQLTYQAGGEANVVPFWSQVDIISVDAYNWLATTTTPTVDQLVAAWNTVPPAKWQAEQLDFKSPVDFYRDLATEYGKPLVFGEIGYRPVNTAAEDPGNYSSWTPLDLQEQKDLYTAFFQ